jgi:hypothetical protein
MAKETSEDKKWHKMGGNSGMGGAVYGLGFVGALVYYIQHSASIWDGLLGILKAILWPAFLVFKFLEFFGM